RIFLDDRRVGREIFSTDEINRQADQHSDAGRAETVMPTHLFAESPGDERRGNDSAVDEEVVNLERIRAPIIAGWIQGAHLAGKVSLKTTNADRKSTRLNSSHRTISYAVIYSPSLHAALPVCSAAGRAETVMPTHLFAESPGDERRGNDSAVDEEVVNLERIRAPIIAGWIQGAHLAGKVSLKTTNADRKSVV